MLYPNSDQKKIQVSTLQLRRRLAELVEPSLRRPTPRKNVQFWHTIRYALPSLLLGLEIGGLLLAIGIGILNLITPELSFSSSCQGRIAGKWQTRWGLVTLTEDGQGGVKGKFEYQHIDRGQVKGELSGKLNNQALEFNWRETYQQKQEQGRGIILFGESCKEFYGSTNSLGGWQGRRI
ncbi:MAG: hypothetical protein ACK4QL_08320 [Pseudanabaenaceae cyanobacterium]